MRQLLHQCGTRLPRTSKDRRGKQREGMEQTLQRIRDRVESSPSADARS